MLHLQFQFLRTHEVIHFPTTSDNSIRSLRLVCTQFTVSVAVVMWYLYVQNLRNPESLPYIEEGSTGQVKDSRNNEVKIQYFPRTMNHFRIWRFYGKIWKVLTPTRVKSLKAFQYLVHNAWSTLAARHRFGNNCWQSERLPTSSCHSPNFPYKSWSLANTWKRGRILSGPTLI